MDTLVVIPAFNEQASVAEVVERVHAVGLDVLVVDDGSSDGTAANARAAGAEVVRLPVNVGVGGALRTGFRYAVAKGYKRAVQVDADLQHDPEAIPDLLAAARSGVDLVIGSRFAGAGSDPGAAPSVSRSRRTAMRLLSRLVRRRTGVNLDDVTSGFRVISEPLLSRFAADYPSEYLGDTVEAILLAHGYGASIAQVPARIRPRTTGDATSSLRAAGHLIRILLVIAARRGRKR